MALDNDDDGLVIGNFNLNRASLVEASAGTGKTFTISYLVVRLLLGFYGGNSDKLLTSVKDSEFFKKHDIIIGGGRPIDIENILVVTFTNAAAADLKARILERIKLTRLCFEHIARERIDDVTDALSLGLDEHMQHMLGRIVRTFPNTPQKPHNFFSSLKAYARLLLKAERSIDKAAISTIHSFCYKALNQIYSFEAGKAFNITLEQDVSQYERQAILEVIRELYYTNSEGIDTRLLLQLVPVKEKSLFDTNLLSRLRKVRLLDDKEGYFGFNLKLKGNYSKKSTPLLCIKTILEHIAGLNARMQEYLPEFSECISFSRDNGGILEIYAQTGAFPDFPDTKKSIGRMLYEFEKEGDALKEEDRLRKFRDLAQSFSKVNPNKQGKSSLYNSKKTPNYSNHDLVIAFEKRLFAVFEPLKSLIAEYNAYKSEIAPFLGIMILLRLDAILDKKNIVSMDGVLRQLAIALNNDPLHAEALKTQLMQRYPVAMIDEFQDTDPIQFAIFKKLYLDRGEDNSLKSVCYFIGDPKQSIYAFRNTDINSYNEARRLILKNNGNIYYLKKNFRSTAELVEGVNAVFYARKVKKQDGENDKTKDEAVRNDTCNVTTEVTKSDSDDIREKEFYPYYDNPFDGTSKTESGIDYQPVSGGHGKVREFYFKNSPKSVSNLNINLDFANWPSDDVLTPQYMNIVVKAVVKTVSSIMEDGYFKSKEEISKVRYQDIAILVRSENQARKIMEGLALKGMQSVYYSDRSSVLRRKVTGNFSDSEEYANTEQAEVILYFMEAMCNLSSFASLRRLLGSALFRLDSGALNRIFESELFDRELALLSEARKVWEYYGFIGAFYVFLKGQKEIISQNGLYRVRTFSGGERDLTNYLHIAELVQGVFSKIDGINAQYLWFKNLLLLGTDADSVKLRLESENDVVKIYSIHSSKGLQFPIVIAPFLYLNKKQYANVDTFYDKETRHQAYASEGYLKQDTNLEKDIKDLCKIHSDQEEIRLAYVALTRAQSLNVVVLNNIGQCHLNTPYCSAMPFKCMVDPRAKEKDGADAKKGRKKTSKTKPEDNSVKTPALSDMVYGLKGFSNDSLFTNVTYNAVSLEKERETYDSNAAPPAKKTLDSYESYADPDSLNSGINIDCTFKISSYSVLSQHSDVLLEDNTDRNFEDQKKSGTRKLDDIRDSFARKFNVANKAGVFFHKCMEILIGNTDETEDLLERINRFRLIADDFLYFGKRYSELDEDARAKTGESFNKWVAEVVNAPLYVEHKGALKKVSLSTLNFENCACEMSFYVPCKNFSFEAFNAIRQEFYLYLIDKFALKGLKEQITPLNEDNFKGFIKGEIDLIGSFSDIGSNVFFLMDYKTNNLGGYYENYTQDDLAISILNSGYDVQILIYSVALHRYLKEHFLEYVADENDDYAASYDKYFGGVEYLYVRAMKEQGLDENSYGTIFFKPPYALITKMEKMLEGDM